jgi:hypothetical protein
VLTVTPTSQVFSVPLDGALDQRTVATIMGTGFSRVPVHAQVRGPGAPARSPTHPAAHPTLCPPNPLPTLRRADRPPPPPRATRGTSAASCW